MRRHAPNGVAARRMIRLRVAARGRARGDYTVRLTARSGAASETSALAARRL